jgi:hypothetical protein
MSAQLAPGGQLLLDPQMYPDGHRMPANPPIKRASREKAVSFQSVQPPLSVVGGLYCALQSLCQKQRNSRGFGSAPTARLALSGVRFRDALRGARGPRRLAERAPVRSNGKQRLGNDFARTRHLILIGIL